MLLQLCIDALPVHPTAVHPRTGEPLRALGRRRNGDPIWPIAGGAPRDDDDEDRKKKDDDSDDSEDDDDDDSDDDDDDSDDDKDKDDDKSKSKKEEDTNTVEYWKRRSRQNERDAKRNARENARLKKDQKPDPKKKASKGKGDDDEDDQPDAEELRRQAKEEAQAEVMRDRVSDKIEAKARKYADPEDAAVMLMRANELDDFLDDDGKIDVEAINEALEELLEKKPYLAASDNGKRFKGGGDGGARQSKKARPKSIGEAVGNRYAKK